LRYKSLTSFYGSVPHPLAYDESGQSRSYRSVEHAIQEAIKLGETGPFTLVTVAELDGNRGDNQADGPPPIYWEPPVKPTPDPANAQKAEARRALQNDLYSAMINLGSKKSDAIAIAKALPIEITELSPALNWAMRRK
jgi:hypothetical protein